MIEPEHYNKLTHGLMTNQMIKKTKRSSQSELSDPDFSNETFKLNVHQPACILQANHRIPYLF
jgi:hypothetical protein